MSLSDATDVCFSSRLAQEAYRCLQPVLPCPEASGLFPPFRIDPFPMARGYLFWADHPGIQKLPRRCAPCFLWDKACHGIPPVADLSRALQNHGHLPSCLKHFTDSQQFLPDSASQFTVIDTGDTISVVCAPGYSPPLGEGNPPVWAFSLLQLSPSSSKHSS